MAIWSESSGPPRSSCFVSTSLHSAHGADIGLACLSKGLVKNVKVRSLVAMKTPERGWVVGLTHLQGNAVVARRFSVCQRKNIFIIEHAELCEDGNISCPRFDILRCRIETVI